MQDGEPSGSIDAIGRPEVEGTLENRDPVEVTLRPDDQAAVGNRSVGSTEAVQDTKREPAATVGIQDEDDSTSAFPSRRRPVDSPVRRLKEASERRRPIREDPE